MKLKFWDNLTLNGKALKIISEVENFVREGINKSYDQFTNVIENIAVGLEKLNMDLDCAIVTLEQIQEANTFLKTQREIIRTPTLLHVQSLFPVLNRDSASSDCADSDIDLYVKLENMQSTGSFKIRGVLNQLRKVHGKHGKDVNLVTMSAGNYGKAFAYALQSSDAKSVCVMPHSAPQNRATTIEDKKLGLVVLITSFPSSALEVLEDVPDPDVVVVNCGGGGLVSGVAAGISLSGHKNCRVYAVEPEGAATMYESFKERRPVTLSGVKSVASGLAAPYAGTVCYRHCRWFVEDILLVSDEEILQTMKLLFHRGIIAEPAGCAALAAVLTGKVPNIQGKKVVVYISGGNVSCTELQKLIPEDP
ncbi:hypothetical protein Btru_043507 [Bulinus truncatus]|nr:hypothetical protein Btru_043507 [Bulinus truncatus]